MKDDQDEQDRGFNLPFLLQAGMFVCLFVLFFVLFCFVFTLPVINFILDGGFFLLFRYHFRQLLINKT